MEWIAVDWGTTSLRAWRMSHEGEILDHATSSDGMGGLAPDQFEPALLALIGDWLRPDQVTTVIACGMVGARQGWIEADYAAVPCTPEQLNLTPAPTKDPRIAVFIRPGLSQRKPSPDVMRGEETQISGYLAQNPQFDGVICLPGTHTKWVQVSAGEVVSFQTTMTGEMFALLSQSSVLRHSVTAEGWDQATFLEAVNRTLSRPAHLATDLFGIRARDLLLNEAASAARGRLSGLLIGLELAATKPYWLGQRVVLIGAPDLCDLYHLGLEAQGLVTERTHATNMTVAGLTAAYHFMTKDAA